jgi:hypothetical protein
MRTRVSLVPALDGSGPCLVRLAETAVPAADPVSPPSIEERVL